MAHKQDLTRWSRLAHTGKGQHSSAPGVSAPTRQGQYLCILELSLSSAVAASRPGILALVRSAPAASAPAPSVLPAARLPTPPSRAASTRLARAASALAVPPLISPPAHGPQPPSRLLTSGLRGPAGTARPPRHTRPLPTLAHAFDQGGDG